MIDFVPDYLLGNYMNLIATFRIYNTRGMVLFYLLGVSLNGSLRISWEMFIVPVIFILIYASASIYNFGFDREVDIANKRNNPFSFTINLSNAYFGAILLAISGLLLSVFTLRPQATFWTSLVLFFIGVVYSHPKIRLSHHPTGKFVAMLATYAIIPALYGATYSTLKLEVVFQIAAISLLYGSFMIYSDIKDVVGDMTYGKRTLAVLLGVKKLTALGIILSLVASLLALFFPPHGNAASTVFLGGPWIFLSIQIIAYKKQGILSNRKYRHIMGYSLILYLMFLIFLMSNPGAN